MKKVNAIDIVSPNKKNELPSGILTVFPKNIDYLDINGINDRIITVEKNQIEKITMADEIVMVLKNAPDSMSDKFMKKFKDIKSANPDIYQLLGANISYLNIGYSDDSINKIYVYDNGKDEEKNNAQRIIVSADDSILIIISKAIADGTKTVTDYLRKN